MREILLEIITGIGMGIGIFCIVFIVYCGIYCSICYVNNGDITKIKLDDRMIDIVEEPGLYYDLSTNVVYYYKDGDCMCPYYTSNGNLTLYKNNEIIEILGE